MVQEGGSCAERGGVPVQEGSRKGLGRGPGRGVPVQEGGVVPVHEGGSGGVPGMVPVQEGGGSCAGWGFLGGSSDNSCARKGGS